MKRRGNVWTIMKKELARFFGDRRMVLSIFLPGLLIYLLYSLMGNTLVSVLDPQTKSYTVQVEEMPTSVSTLIQAADLPFFVVEMDDPKAAVEAQELDLYVVFPSSFDQKVEALEMPDVEVYYNSASTPSANAYTVFTKLLDEYESMLANRFNVNKNTGTRYDLATAEDTTGMLFSMLMPMLLIMMTFTGCMAVAPESIAGEKERGTIATLLVTPLRRSELAIGKIAALSLISLLSGLCSFLGVFLSLPQLMGGDELGMIDANIYGVADYAWILGVILSTVLLFVSLISVISTLANSVKEASGMISPLMIVVTLIGITGMFGGGESALWKALIPVYNSVQCISGVFSLSYEPIFVVLTMVVNCLCTCAAVFLLTKMFNSENVMFKK